MTPNEHHDRNNPHQLQFSTGLLDHVVYIWTSSE